MIHCSSVNTFIRFLKISFTAGATLGTASRLSPLESAFGTLRRDQRRISGRKETTSLRVFGPGEISLLALDEEEVLPLLQSVPADEYWSQRRLQEEREEPRRWLTRLHRDPAQALAQVDEQLYMVANAQAAALPDAPSGSY